MEKVNIEKEFFLTNGNRRKLKHNPKCLKCVCECKQSYKACVVVCPYYTAKQKGDKSL